MEKKFTTISKTRTKFLSLKLKRNNFMQKYSRCTPLAEKEEPGKSKLYNAWSYLLMAYKDKEGTLLKSEWDAEEVIKQAIWNIGTDEIAFELYKSKSVQ